MNVGYDELEKYYQEQEEKFYRSIEIFAGRIFNNKICVVDESKYVFPGFSAKLEEYMSEDEDFRNAQITYGSKRIKLTGDRILTVYRQEDSKKRLNEVRVYAAKTLAEFMDIILKIDPVEDHKCVYRGHGNWIYDMVPGIYREQNQNLLKHESEYLKEIISSNPGYFTNCKSALDFLAVLQHYGFPTRLLDFTENPLVALYMACASDSAENGEVLRIDISKDSYKYYDSDTVSLLANLAFFDDDLDVSDFDYFKYEELFDLPSGYTYNQFGKCLNEPLRADMVRRFNDRKDIKRLVHKVRNERPGFANEIDPQHLSNTILLVKPRQDFKRLALQSGLFAIFGIDRKKQEKVDFEFQNLEFRIIHIVIPDECKMSILKELDTININEGTLYGDMDNIVKHYVRKKR